MTIPLLVYRALLWRGDIYSAVCPNHTHTHTPLASKYSPPMNTKKAVFGDSLQLDGDTNAQKLESHITHCLRAARVHRSVVHLYMRLACGISFPSLACQGQGAVTTTTPRVKEANPIQHKRWRILPGWNHFHLARLGLWGGWNWGAVAEWLAPVRAKEQGRIERNVLCLPFMFGFPENSICLILF